MPNCSFFFLEGNLKREREREKKRKGKKRKRWYACLTASGSKIKTEVSSENAVSHMVKDPPVGVQEQSRWCVGMVPLWSRKMYLKTSQCSFQSPDSVNLKLCLLPFQESKLFDIKHDIYWFNENVSTLYQASCKKLGTATIWLKLVNNGKSSQHSL